MDNSLISYGTNSKRFNFGSFEYNYRYRIPVNPNRGANYNSGYIEGYQRALKDFQKSANKVLANNKIRYSFSNY